MPSNWRHGFIENTLTALEEFSAECGGLTSWTYTVGPENSTAGNSFPYIVVLQEPGDEHAHSEGTR